GDRERPLREAVGLGGPSLIGDDDRRALDRLESRRRKGELEGSLAYRVEAARGVPLVDPFRGWWREQREPRRGGMDRPPDLERVRPRAEPDPRQGQREEGDQPDRRPARASPTPCPLAASLDEVRFGRAHIGPVLPHPAERLFERGAA